MVSCVGASQPLARNDRHKILSDFPNVTLDDVRAAALAVAREGRVATRHETRCHSGDEHQKT